jgi:hypothetical protein
MIIAATSELIASENFTSTAVLEALGSHFTNKYSEGMCARNLMSEFHSRLPFFSRVSSSHRPNNAKPTCMHTCTSMCVCVHSSIFAVCKIHTRSFVQVCPARATMAATSSSTRSSRCARSARSPPLVSTRPSGVCAAGLFIRCADFLFHFSGVLILFLPILSDKKNRRVKVSCNLLEPLARFQAARFVLFGPISIIIIFDQLAFIRSTLHYDRSSRILFLPLPLPHHTPAAQA